MKYTPQNNLSATADLQAYIAKNNLSSNVDLEKTGTIMTAPVDGATGVNIAGPLEWEQYGSFLRYRLMVIRDSDSVVVVNTTVVGTSYDPDLDASTLYSWVAYAITPKPQSSPTPDPVVSSITLSPSAPNVEPDSTVEITATVNGTNLTDTTVTWAKDSGDEDITIQSSTDNTLTVAVSATASDDDNAVFSATSGQDDSVVETVTVTAEVAPSGTVDTLEGDVQALEDIYDVLDGANWTDNTGWDSLTTANMGDAFGVEVWESGEHAGRVRVLHLFDNGLTNIVRDGGGDKDLDSRGRYQLISGRGLKESLGNLKQMEYIDLRMNEITGNIPDSFWLLSNLQIAALGFADQIRWGAPNNDLRDYTDIYGSKRPYEQESGQSNNGAQYTGSIPSTISNMTSLEIFLCERNYFDQTPIPQELFELPNLTHIGLSHNGHTGSLANVELPTNVEYINIRGGSFDRSTTSFFEQNTPHYYLSGNLPSLWGSASNLRTLQLHYNEFTGSIPTEWSGMTSAFNVILGHNPDLGGNFPDFTNKSNWPSLNTFYIDRTDVEGSIDSAYDFNEDNLAVFSIGFTNISGELPDAMKNSSDPNFPFKLKILNIINLNFTGDFIDDMSSMYQLRQCFAQGCGFTGTLPSDYTDSTNLSQFYLSSNNFEGAIPSTLGNMVTPSAILLNENLLTSYETGAISPVVLSGGNYVSGLRKLETFSVHTNSLSQSDLDQIILDMWDNVQSRQGTTYENWGNNAKLDVSNQTTDDTPSDTTEINDAISGLEAAGWTVTT